MDIDQLEEAGRQSTIFEHWSKNGVNTVFDNVLNPELRLDSYLNSTNAATWVTIGALVILMAAVGLYLYDFYATARSDTVPQYGPYGEKSDYGSKYYNKR
jgi:hypothetical protein